MSSSFACSTRPTRNASSRPWSSAWQGSLALESSKTRLVAFGRLAERPGKWPETVTFLGFTHYGTRHHRGNFKVGGKTDQSQRQRSLAKFHQLLQIIRHESLEEQVKQINQVLRVTMLITV
jgi:RNA-directed DNA polymerase